jgi:epoxyqueuosine reductase
MGPALAELESFARAHGATRTKSYVDTGPVLERDWAALTGLGWIGKNTTLINQRLGSWLFLGVLLLDAELTPDEPHPDRCGTCTECIDACPTGALTAPYLLDSRLCISYLTIEHKGAIPQRLRPLIGDWVFGCDVCQTVCPWNNSAAAVRRPAFAPRPGLNLIDLEFALRHPEELTKLAAGTPVERAKGTRLLRNIVVAAGNSRAHGPARALESYAVNPPAELAELVGWALKRIRG